MRLILTITAALLVTGCSQQQDPEIADNLGNTNSANSDAPAPVIYTVNYPLAWAATELAGTSAQVQFPAPANVDPAFWQPDQTIVGAYQQANLVILNGANYARWIARVSMPQNRLLDTSLGFSEQLIAQNTGPQHSHGPKGDHSHGELAFTIWLDLELYSQQVSTIATALSGMMPTEDASIAARRDALLARLQVLDNQLMSIGKQLDGAPILYSHPVYQYLQRRYQLNGKALHWEPQQAPAASEWAKLDALQQSHPARLMLWEAEPLADTRAQLEQRGIQAVVLRPMGNHPDNGSFLDNLQADSTGLDSAVRALLAQQ